MTSGAAIVLKLTEP